MVAGALGARQPHPHPLANHSMVAAELLDLAVANQVKPAIADMRCVKHPPSAAIAAVQIVALRRSSGTVRALLWILILAYCTARSSRLAGPRAAGLSRNYLIVASAAIALAISPPS